MDLFEKFDNKKIDIIFNYLKLNKQNKHKMVEIPIFKK
jgi:hypothetical protein